MLSNGRSLGRGDDGREREAMGALNENPRQALRDALSRHFVVPFIQ